jgi:acyl-CoA thioester hydrolase
MSLPAVSVRKTVEFAETDAAGFLHFSNYLRYVEIAERVLFAQLGCPLLEEREGRLSGFPRVRVQCDYSAPLYFGDEVEVHLKVVEWSPRSVSYRFRLERLGPGSRERVAKGSMTTVFAVLDRSSGRLESASLPAALRERLESAAASPEA